MTDRGFHPFNGRDGSSTIKVADTENPGRYETVLDDIDWFSSVSYGSAWPQVAAR